MPDKTLLVLLDEVRLKTLRFLQGLDTAQALWTPPGLQNSILWHAGHCYELGERLAMASLGHAVQEPGCWFDLFGWLSDPGEISPDRWPPLEDIVGRLVGQHDRLRQAIGQASDATLSGPTPGDPSKTVRFSVVHGLHDEGCHSGEILQLRKMQGLGRPARV